VGVSDEPYSAKPAQLSIHTMDGQWTRFQPMCMYWQACTATPLSGVSWLFGSSKAPATGLRYFRWMYTCWIVYDVLVSQCWTFFYFLILHRKSNTCILSIQNVSQPVFSQNNKIYKVSNADDVSIAETSQNWRSIPHFQICFILRQKLIYCLKFMTD